MSFWGELKRRNVFKVGAAYVIIAWLIVQVANTFFPILHLPEWAVTLVAVLVILGLPLALLFAWAFELTPEGIKKTEHVPLEESITRVTGKKLDYILGALLLIAVAYIVFDNYYLDRREVQTDASKTIAVLPFENLSSDPEQEYFVDGLSEELLNCLAKINGLRVTSRTSAFSFKGTNKTVQEIADVLGVDHILEGSVRKAGDALRITAQLIRVKDDSHLWSNTYDRELKDIFAIQEDISAAVADELKATLGIETSTIQMGSTNNLEAYQHFVVAQGKLASDEIRSAIESLDAAIALDPDFALAWANKAIGHIKLANNVPSNQAASERAAGLNAARKAIEINPDLPEAYVALASYNRAKADFVGAELAYRRASELKPEILWGIGSNISVYYLAVGYFEKAGEIIDSTLQTDPLNLQNRVILILYNSILGKTEGAEDAYEAVRSMYPPNFWANNLVITFARLGTDGNVSRGRIPEIPSFDPFWSTAREFFESPEDALVQIRGLYNKNNLSAQTQLAVTMWAAYFGDPEFALDIAERAQTNEAGSISYLWDPVFRKVRQLPRFKEFVRKIGLVDYWNQFGWPDICRPLNNGDFECD